MDLPEPVVLAKVDDGNEDNRQRLRAGCARPPYAPHPLQRDLHTAVAEQDRIADQLRAQLEMHGESSAGPPDPDE